MARASIRTLLSLDRYAKIMQIDPLRFNGGNEIYLADGSKLFPIRNEVQAIWPQYGYQTEQQVGREEIAQNIAEAERDIAEYLGWFPAPVWLEQEQHVYPPNWRVDAFGNGQTYKGKFKSLKAKYGKFISSGQRAVSVVQAGAAVVYSDEDGDGFDETATITVATSLTDLRELKVYVPGKSGAQVWEIRDPKSVTVSGGNFVAVFNTWQMIDPDVWERFPTDENNDSPTGIDVTDTGNLLATVDVYREYNDFTATGCTFMWEHLANEQIFCSVCSGTGCPQCEYTTQNGCVHTRDVDNGIVVPVPATYDSDNEQWYQNGWSVCREPDLVKLYYRCGLMSEDYINGNSYDPLSNFFAQVIAYLATARLDRLFGENNNVTSFSKALMRDRSLQQDGGNSYFDSEEARNNPFGTRQGEIYAYRQLKHFAGSKVPKVVGTL